MIAKESLEKLGDVGQYVVPLSALSFSLIKSDFSGVYCLGKATALTLTATYVLKYSCNSTRPNGGHHSFPSGHSAFAFSGAAYLDRRYGFQIGLPAYVASAFVGYTRVQAKAHRTVDVIGAAVLAYFSNRLCTPRWQCIPSYHGDEMELSFMCAF